MFRWIAIVEADGFERRAGNETRAAEERVQFCGG